MTPEAFWLSLDRSGPDAEGLGPCWVWTRGRCGNHRPWERRYGSAVVDGVKGMAHQLAWSLTNGPVPSRLLVLHKCDNPPCCNPAHLEVGTQLTNRRQAAKRERTCGKLDTLDIHVAYARGESQRSIADRLGVARNSVVCVLSGVTFHHVFDAVHEWTAAPLARTGTEE